MGDRGNIVLQYESMKYPDHPRRIFLYSHWGGTEMPHILQKALQKRWRWEDSAYLGRIIFNELTRDFEDTETNFGLSPFMCDNEHDFLVVDFDTQRVIRETEQGKTIRSWGFEDYCKIKPTNLPET